MLSDSGDNIFSARCGVCCCRRSGRAFDCLGANWQFSVEPALPHHWRSKPKTLFRNSLDKWAAMVCLAQRLPDCPDVLGDIGFLNKTVRPQPADQFFFFDEMTRSLHEHDQSIECLRRQRDRLRIVQQPALVRFELERAEFVDEM